MAAGIFNSTAAVRFVWESSLVRQTGATTQREEERREGDEDVDEGKDGEEDEDEGEQKEKDGYEDEG